MLIAAIHGIQNWRYAVNVQSTSALFFSSVSTYSASVQKHPAASTVNTADTVSISQKARDLYAATSAENSDRLTFDTDKGTTELDIESYFAPPGSQGVDLDSLPLLMPSQKNIDALSNYISSHMAGFLADNGIPSPPASISYDNRGQIQLPADYAYADEFKQALEDNPVMDRVLSTTSALSSTMVEMNKSIPFQCEYAAATSQAQINAVVAKYSHLFSSNRSYDSIALNFTAEGTLSITHNGKSLSEV
jgi:hypothetical protein